MTRKIDYYFSVASPWAFLGHTPFMAIAEGHKLNINFKPVLLGPIFDQTGGLPLPKRHPVRQRYRLVEMQRWREKRGVTLNLKPAHVPFDPSLADRMAIAIVMSGQDPANYLTRALAGIWQEEKNLGDPAVIAACANAAGLNGAALIETAQATSTEAIYLLNRENAVEAGVFGSPSFVVDGEVFWGQDRLDLLDDMLTSSRAAFLANV
jgi:2-hydroxychromene-2-carboxylate isomerase